MFDLNHGPAAEQTEKKDGLPIIPLPEDSEIIRLLLDFLYPHATEPQFYDVELFWDVSKAAKKYCMDIIENKLIDHIMESKLIDRQPLSIYAVATDLEWEDVANSAARKVLKRQGKWEENSEFLPSLYCEELQRITGTGFYRFLEYFFRARSGEAEEKKLATSFTSARTADTEDLQVLSDVAKEDPPCGFDRFRSLSNADVVLRSSDSVDFFVSSTLMRLVSPIFDGMFPLKHHESQDGRPIISIQESSEVLLRVLRVTYHDPGELEITDYMGMVKATRKYEMTAIERTLQRQLETSALVLKEPFRIYPLATKFGWKDVAKKAALNTLLQPLRKMTHVPELDLVTGADLYRLVDFRFKCGERACTALQSDRKISSYWVDDWDKYRSRGNTIDCRDWYENLRECPRGTAMTDIYKQELQVLEVKGGSFNLPNHVFSGILKCVCDAGKVVEDAVSEVTLEMDEMDESGYNSEVSSSS